MTTVELEQAREAAQLMRMVAVELRSELIHLMSENFDGWQSQAGDAARLRLLDATLAAQSASDSSDEALGSLHAQILALEERRDRELAQAQEEALLTPLAPEAAGDCWFSDAIRGVAGVR